MVGYAGLGDNDLPEKVDIGFLRWLLLMIGTDCRPGGCVGRYPQPGACLFRLTLDARLTPT